MTLSGYVYRTSAGESFDSLALNVYGDEKYAKEIMTANPQYCGLTVFYGGEEIALPAIELPSDNEEAKLANTIAPWKR